MLADGETTREIAQQLSYSERTVKNIVHDLLAKLNCRTQRARGRARRAPRRDLTSTGERAVSRKVAVIGLDCAEPKLVFDRWLEELPNLRAARWTRGTWGPLRSVDPPITVPAWSCMMTGLRPRRARHLRLPQPHATTATTRSWSPTRGASRTDRVWDHLSRAGKHVIVVGVPQTSPPVPVNGELVSCFLTADTRTDPYTYPAAACAPRSSHSSAPTGWMCATSAAMTATGSSPRSTR